MTDTGGGGSWGSDAPQGPGWWQASDGKWYPPQNPTVATAAPPTAATAYPPAAYPQPYPQAYPQAAYGGAPRPVANGRRFGAFLLEGLLVIVTLAIGWIIWSLIIWKDGYSPAKKMMNMRVVKVEGGQPATWGTMALRELVGKGILGNITFGITTLVSGFMILGNGQGIWDKMASTTVVDERPGQA